MQFAEPKTRSRVVISVAPLIDVLFLLLTFFMISSTFLEQPGIKLELPAAETAEVRELRAQVLVMTVDQGMRLNDRQISKENLTGALRRGLGGMKDATLILRADREVTHGEVVGVMDIAKKAGIRRLVVATKMPEEEEEEPESR